MIGPLALREVLQIELLPVFNLTWTENHGVSLGLLTANSETQRWALVALTAVIAVVVLVWMLRETKLGDVLPLGLVLGGALGNILDRSRLGYVVDYADLHFGDVPPVPDFQPRRCRYHHRRRANPCPVLPFARKAEAIPAILPRRA